jgi:hypothetical protein
VHVCDSLDDKGNMVLGNIQYTIKESDNVAPIGLIHHPLNWFKDHVEADRYLRRVPILLFGHEHAHGWKRIEDQHGIQARIYSGAVTPPGASEEFPYQYNWIEIALTGPPDARQLRVTLWPRRWHFVEKRFQPDWYSLNGKSCHVIDVPCPRFRSEAPVNISSDATPPKAVGQVMEATEDDFERLKYFFWTYLDWQARVKALSALDLLPNTITQPQPQTLENIALRAAQQKGKLPELWDMTMASVPQEEQAPNPFTK